MSAVISGPDPYGEGVFETVHLRPGGPWLLDEHLDRLTRSAALLDLPLPSRAELTTMPAAPDALPVLTEPVAPSSEIELLPPNWVVFAPRK